MEKIKVLLKTADERSVPKYMTEGAAGMDLCARQGDTLVIHPGEVGLIPTGLYVAVPEGFELQVRPRSGLALKGLTVLNSPGTIDSDYRGEIKIILANFGKNDLIVHPGDRIAQMVLSKVYRAEFELTDLLDPTERNAGGFGHTGV